MLSFGVEKDASPTTCVTLVHCGRAGCRVRVTTRDSYFVLDRSPYRSAHEKVELTWWWRVGFGKY